MHARSMLGLCLVWCVMGLAALCQIGCGRSPEGSAGTPTGKLPPGFDRAFLVPTETRDQHGNPVVRRNGSLYDPKTGYPYEIHLKKPRMEFVLIPAGEFMMGSENGGPDEKPVHKVRLSKPFYLSKYEATQGQWSSATGTSPWSGKRHVKSDARNPAVQISWQDCQGFLKALGEDFRLPTEAEWECACQAGSTAKFCFGDNESKLKDYAWFEDNAEHAGENYAHAVGRKKPNAWGLYDMHGNVWEWCHDWKDNYLSGPQTDPLGASSGTHRVRRGSGFCGVAWGCRCTARFRYDPTYCIIFVGLRPARSLPSGPIPGSTDG